MTVPGRLRRESWTARLFSRRAAVLLGRNTVVSVGAFLLGLGLLWLLVERAHVNKLVAAGVTFLLANSLQYVLARSWIFRGTRRGLVQGYGYFLFNAAVGLAITVGLFAAFISFTGVHYLAARVLVSVVAGLAMFLLNAILNFRRL